MKKTILSHIYCIFLNCSKLKPKPSHLCFVENLFRLVVIVGCYIVYLGSQEMSHNVMDEVNQQRVFKDSLMSEWEKVSEINLEMF